MTMEKRKIAIAVIALAMVAVLSSGLIYAYFNDTETSSGNSFAAGTLDLKINGADGGVPATFSASNLAPGAHGNVEMTVSNVGTVGGGLVAQISNVVNTKGTTPEPEPLPDNGELSSAIVLTVYLDSNGNDRYDAGDFLYDTGVLSTIGGSYNMGALAAGGSVVISIEYTVPTSVGNEIMGDGCTFDIVYTLTQAS
jgi:predicted ribosomally synthesized peptide with SipW-like signal peptide